MMSATLSDGEAAANDGVTGTAASWAPSWALRDVPLQNMSFSTFVRLLPDHGV
jgi:hypothetical protein